MNELAVAIVIILFPGILATIISDKVTVHNTRWDSFKFGMYSFVLGASCYILLQIVTYSFDLIFSMFIGFNHIEWSHLEVWSIITNTETKIKLLELFQAILLALPVAFFASYLINHKIFNKLSKKLHISNKYGDENLFSYYLTSNDIDWVYVRDIENNLTYQGRVDSYSENDKIQEIVLYNVTVFSYDESDELYSLPSIYLCKSMGKFIIESVPIEFLEEDDEKATN